MLPLHHLRTHDSSCRQHRSASGRAPVLCRKSITCNQQGSGLPRAGTIAEDMHIIAQHSSGNLPLELTPSKHAEEYATGLVSRSDSGSAADVSAGRWCCLSTR